MLFWGRNFSLGSVNLTSLTSLTSLTYDAMDRLRQMQITTGSTTKLSNWLYHDAGPVLKNSGTGRG